MKMKISLKIFLPFILYFALSGFTRAAANLRVNEIMYSPPQNDRGGEWIELYNPGNENVVVAGGTDKNAWTFIDSSGTHFLAKEPLTGSLIVEPKNYLILADDAEAFKKNYPNFSGNLVDTAMNLPNDFGFIQIKDGQGNVVSQALWSSNLGADRNQKTLEFANGIFREGLRNFGSPGLENSVENLVLPPAPTPILPSPSPKPPVAPLGSEPLPKTGKVVINEIFYNPGKNNRPWVEIKNQEARKIDLAGWKIIELENKNDFFLQGEIPANGFKVFPLPSLNRNSETLRLFDGDGKKIFEVKYASPIPVDWSASRFANATWRITSKPTPEKENLYSLPQEIKNDFVPQELIPNLAFETATSINQQNLKPPGQNDLILKGLGLSLSAALGFILLKKRLII